MDAAEAKLFIGGISWETTEEDLREHFHHYGAIVEAVIMKDRNTGRSRGFGFVSFANSAAADLALLDKHTINNRVVEAKKAVPRAEQQSIPRSNTSNGGQSPEGLGRTTKIFVGGLASTVTREEFRRYFEQFGPLSDAVVMYDHDTQHPRGFGFVTYASEDSAVKVLQRSFHELNGKMVEVKPAVPRELSPVTQSPVSGGTAARERQALYAVSDVGYGARGYPYAAYGNPVALGNFPGGYGTPGYGTYGGPAGYGPGYGSRTGWSAAAAYPYAGTWGLSAYPGGSNYSGGYYATEGGYETGYGARDTGYGGGSPGSFATGRSGTGNYGSGYADPYGYADSTCVDEVGSDSIGLSAAEEAINGYGAYGATNKQAQRGPDARFRSHPAANDRT